MKDSNADPLVLSYELHQRHLVLRITGTFDVASSTSELMRTFLYLENVPELSFVVFDNRGLTRTLFATEKALFGSMLVDLYVAYRHRSNHEIHFALIAPGPGALLSLRPFQETIEAAGIKITMLDDEKAYQEWLAVHGLDETPSGG